MMNPTDQNDRDRIPEDDDPAYDNPVGKLPPQTDDRAAKVRQPFDFDNVTVFHTESERENLLDDWWKEVLPEMRTREMKKTLATLEAFRKQLRGIRERDLFGKTDDAKQARAEKEREMYSEAIDIWVSEISLFMRDLRQELADLIEQKYPECGKNLAVALRSGLI